MSRSYFWQRSLKARITSAMLGIFLLSLWALGYYASYALRQDMERRLGEQQLSTVALIAAQLNRELTGRLDALSQMALASTAPMQQGAAAVQAMIEQGTTVHALFNGGIYVTGRDGTALADFPLPAKRVGVNYLDREYIATPLRTGVKLIGRPVIGKRSGAPVFVMSVPIRDQRGDVIGVIAGVTRLDAANFLDEISAGRYGQSGGYLLITAKQRQIVTASNKNWVMDVLPARGKFPQLDRFIEGDEGAAVVINPQGVEDLVSAREIPVAGWYLMVHLPTAEAFSPIYQMQRRMWLATIVLTLLAGGLIWGILRRQLSPLQRAAQALSVRSDAKQPPPPLPMARDDEIGQLIAAFNRLLATLARREGALRESELRFRSFSDASSAGILIHEGGIILDCNEGLARMTGYRVDELVGKDGLFLVSPEWRELVVQKIRSGGDQNYDVVGLHRDGTPYQLSVRGCTIPYQGRPVRATEFLDISERKRAEEKLQLAASVFTHAREAILITAPDGTIIDVNDSFLRITGYGRDEVIGRHARLLASGQQDPAFYTNLWRDLVDKGHWYGELWIQRKNGELFASLQTIGGVRDAQGALRQYVAMFSDITAQKAQQKQLEHIAHYDALTALPNRVLLADRLGQAMAQAPRQSKRLAVVYLDLDGFKAINDRHGHEIGDQLLIAMACSMAQALREGDTLARLGGDEFVAVLPDLGEVERCLPILDRLLAAATCPVAIGDLQLQVSASLGVSFYPQDEDLDADQLLRQADQAMYQAKQAGKNRYHLFDAEHDRNVRGHHENIERVRQALAAREFVLYYQPKVNMRTGAVLGLEALIRWQHPQRGLLPPAVFLPVIDDHPLAVALGEWVIDSVLAQMAAWQAAGLDLPVSVNVGARQLQQYGFVQRLRELLAAHPTTRRGDLELEVLESCALEDLSGVAQVIEECAALGVASSLDDFGTGYSSLTYLKRLSVNQIKIDQSFVHDMRDHPDDLALLEGILGLAKAFHRQVIAEGVESVEQGTMLLQLGCERAQGYGIAPPLAAADVAAWVAHWRPDAAWSGLRPLDSGGLPLLFACVEYRAWIRALEKHLHDEHCAPPALAPDFCRFGLWLDDARQARYGADVLFPSIQALHRQFHELATGLCELRRHGQHAEAMARLGELSVLRDALLAQLQLLLQAQQR